MNFKSLLVYCALVVRIVRLVSNPDVCGQCRTCKAVSLECAYFVIQAISSGGSNYYL